MYDSYRERLLEFAEEGILSWESLALMALKFMSEDELKEMARMNELDLEDEDE